MINQEIQQAFDQLAYEFKLSLDKIKDEVAKADRDGYLGDLYRTDFTVTGRGAFPVDMLRYCNAWPCTESDAGSIERSHENDGVAADAFTIRLTKYHRDPTPNLSEERWFSKFRWRVISTGTSTSRL